jgi:hypothetical protein
MRSVEASGLAAQKHDLAWKQGQVLAAMCCLWKSYSKSVKGQGKEAHVYVSTGLRYAQTAGKTLCLGVSVMVFPEEINI